MEAAVAPLPELSLIVRRRGPHACDARFMSLKMLQVSRAAPCHLPRGCLCSSEASAAAGNGNAQGHETLTDGKWCGCSKVTSTGFARPQPWLCGSWADVVFKLPWIPAAQPWCWSWDGRAAHLLRGRGSRSLPGYAGEGSVHRSSLESRGENEKCWKGRKEGVEGEPFSPPGVARNGADTRRHSSCLEGQM